MLFRIPWCEGMHCYFGFYLWASISFCASISGFVKSQIATFKVTFQKLHSADILWVLKIIA
jgi:hypothetical protein